MLLALLIAASASGKLAVLELKNKLPKQDRAGIDATFLTDSVRMGAIDRSSGLEVMTRENVLVLLEASGRKLEDCEGECEVETGRRLGADYIVSGELLKFGSSLKVNLRLHDTRSGALLAGALVTGKSADDLDGGMEKALDKLFKPLVATAAKPAEVAKAPEPPKQQETPKPAEPVSLAGLTDVQRMEAIFLGRWSCSATSSADKKVYKSTYVIERQGDRLAATVDAPQGKFKWVQYVSGDRFVIETPGAPTMRQKYEFTADALVYGDSTTRNTARRAGNELKQTTEIDAGGQKILIETVCQLAG
jgi:TolB-like protein